MSKTSRTCCPADPTAMQVLEGPGWRLCLDGDRVPYAVLIGGGVADSVDWAAEFTMDEAQALRRAASTLVGQHRSLLASLMEEEAIDLSMELPCGEGDLWVALEGDRHRWSLSFVLSPGGGRRGIEGRWGTQASEALAAALDTLLDSQD